MLCKHFVYGRAQKGNHMKEKSSIRGIYTAKLAGRILVLCLCGFLYVFDRSEFDILRGMHFFERFSVLHILWIIWMIDMLWQLVPVNRRTALGSKKLFRAYYRPARGAVNKQALKAYIKDAAKSAYKVFLLWAALTAAMGVLYQRQIIDDAFLFMSAVFFYVCDLVCVLVWCPFRLIMRSRCCTTCRIFNWDHLMMVTPLAGVRSFFCGSLVAAALFVFLLWEYRVYRYPKRFFEGTNDALKCRNCTDLLCKKKRRDKNPDYPL